MPSGDYRGLLVIGDPHLESRTPGFRMDDYAKVILEKFGWCLGYAQKHHLLPALLGDIFDKPRDNPTWMLGSLIDMLTDVECVGVYGNHDCADPQLSDHDSLSLLAKAGRVRLLDDRPWRGTMNGTAVLVGGSSYRKTLPDRVESGGCDPSQRQLTCWLTHHDILVPGYEEHGRIKPKEIEGIDLVINGHIHRRLADVQMGRTIWMTPGNISRRSRNDATKDHTPAALRVDVLDGRFKPTYVEIPHRPFAEVFHAGIEETPDAPSGSGFVAGLKELLVRRTAGGAGLGAFLDQNIAQFEPLVAAEIRKLAKEVWNHG